MTPLVTVLRGTRLPERHLHLSVGHPILAEIVDGPERGCPAREPAPVPFALVVDAPDCVRTDPDEITRRQFVAFGLVVAILRTKHEAGGERRDGEQDRGLDAYATPTIAGVPAP